MYLFVTTEAGKVASAILPMPKLGSFSLVFKLHTGVQLILRKDWFIEIYHSKDHCIDSLFEILMQDMRQLFEIKDFKLYYIDDERDYIPITTGCELEEAIKAAITNLPSRSIPLHVILGREDKLRCPSVPCAPIPSGMIGRRTGSKMAASEVWYAGYEPETTEDRVAAIIKSFLESYKQNIVADVTNEVIGRLTKALNPSAEPSARTTSAKEVDRRSELELAKKLVESLLSVVNDKPRTPEFIHPDIPFQRNAQPPKESSAYTSAGVTNLGEQVNLPNTANVNSANDWGKFSSDLAESLPEVDSPEGASEQSPPVRPRKSGEWSFEMMTKGCGRMKFPFWVKVSPEESNTVTSDLAESLPELDSQRSGPSPRASGQWTSTLLTEFGTKLTLPFQVRELLPEEYLPELHPQPSITLPRAFRLVNKTGGEIILPLPEGVDVTAAISSYATDLAKLFPELELNGPESPELPPQRSPPSPRPTADLPNETNTYRSDLAEALLDFESPENSEHENVWTSYEEEKAEGDNNSIHSNSSNVSDFVVEDHPEEVENNHEALRRASSNSSFEVVSENSPEQTPVPEMTKFPHTERIMKEVCDKLTERHKRALEMNESSLATPTETCPIDENVGSTSSEGKFSSAPESSCADSVSQDDIDSEYDDQSSTTVILSKYAGDKPQVIQHIKGWESTILSYQFGGSKSQQPKVYRAEDLKPAHSGFLNPHQDNYPTSQCLSDSSYDDNVSKGLGDTKNLSPNAVETIKGLWKDLSHHENPKRRWLTREEWWKTYGPRTECPSETSTNEYAQILPEPLLAGAIQAASSAYTTARKAIDKITSPMSESRGEPKLPSSSYTSNEF